MKLAVILLSCAQVHLTNDVVADIAREADDDIDLYVCDNSESVSAGYQRQWRETIIKPPRNLRWVIGVNNTIKLARALGPECGGGYDAFVALNDDIRLSPGFFDAIRDALSDPSVGLVAPSYDDVYRQQVNRYRGPAAGYVSREGLREVPFVDGTAFAMTSRTISHVGLLDEKRFGVYGWGSDIDYCWRMRQAGLKVAVTFDAFINHFHQGSAKFVEDDWSGKAGMEMEAGMNEKYGEGWRERLGFSVG